MNKSYRLIWSTVTNSWLAVSELARRKGKSSTVNRKVHSLFGSLSVLGLICGTTSVMATDVTVSTYTPTALNYDVGAYEVGADTVNMSGNIVFTGVGAKPVTSYGLNAAYDAGFVTGPYDPHTTIQMVFGGKTNGVAVYDSVTGSNVTISTYVSSGISQRFVGDAYSVAIYSPTAAGSEPFVDATLATVSGGGTLNFNVTGNVGHNSTKETTFIEVTNGTANWNSKNTVFFAGSDAAVRPDQIVPQNLNTPSVVYNGAFTVTTTDGVQSHSVTDLASFQTYNTWLIQQLQAGKLGNGSVAQAAYDAALNKAYTARTITYVVDPAGGQTISPTDPIFTPVGTRAAMSANGASANAIIGATGGITLNAGTGLLATNGGTVVNNGVLTNYYQGVGIQVSAGGHAVNNGIRYVGPATGSRTEGLPDQVTGAGSTYVNTGIINISGWNGHKDGTRFTQGLSLIAGASGSNEGTINVGNVTMLASSTATGVEVNAAGIFSNNAPGVIYLGRDAGTDTSLAPIDRGGADVVQSNATYGISVAGGAGAVRNAGTIVVGDKVQNAIAISVFAGGTANIDSSGSIVVNGHYSAVPLQNIGILSKANGIINNSGVIDLKGINVVGIKATAGGKVQSSGTINVLSGADVASGIRNYGVWSEGANSLASISGAVNLSGDGAIGVHARASGAAEVTGNGAVVFQSGTNQIGYFIYGSNAKVTNTGTGTQDVSTEGSVLFRMEDGADFTGGAGATSTLIASGADSTAVVVTGRTGTDVSAFNSGGMTINATGEGAVAVLVEGGAQGKIAANATINLTGVGAIAGIADGQKHALDGSVSGAPIAGTLGNGSLSAGAAGFGTGTLLVAQANLNSALDNVTGYVAKNGASLDNSGNIIFTGKDTTGIHVYEGSTGGNTGTITIQDGSTGLIASSSGANTTLNNSGNLILKGGDNTSRTTGISADGSAVTVNMTSGTIDMQGQGAIGAVARNGSTVNLSGTASALFSTTETDQIMLLVSGNGSTINTNTSGGSLDASGKNSTLIRLENEATQSGVLSMKASGDGARGIWATGVGTKVEALSGSNFEVGGNNAMAVLVEGGADVSLKAGTTITLAGTNTIVGTVDGNEYALDGTTVIGTNTGSKLVSEATLNSSVAGATGFVAQNQGNLINNGEINFTGANSQAVKVLDGIFTNQKNITANGVAVYVEGADAKVDVQAGLIKATDGEAAIKIGQDAALNLMGSGLGKVTASGTAHAVLVASGARGLVVDGAWIDMASTGAGTGNGIENQAEISGIQLTSTTKIDVMDGKGVRTSASLAEQNAGTINVMGSGTGLAFEKADGSATSNNLDFSDSNGLTINVSGVGGQGLLVNHAGNGDVKNGANILVTNAAGGSAVVLDGVATFTNTGNLNSASSAAAVIDLGVTTTVINASTGKIESATGTALNFDNQNSTLSNQGKITGLVSMNEGNNTVTNAGILAGNVTAGDGNNTVVLESGSSSQDISAGTGVNQFTVKGTATFLALDGGMGTGEDTLNFDGATYLLSNAAALQHFEKLNLINNSVFTTNVVLDMTNTAGGVGKVDIASGSQLAVKNVAAGNYVFNHALTGSGVISSVLNAATNSFDFGADVGSDFAGTAKLGTGTFALAGDNTTALTNATLQLDTGNVTTVGTGNQAIGGLTYNGGKTIFNVEIPADKEATGKITTSGTLDVSGTGTVQVSIPSDFANDQPLVDTKLSLLEQDDQTALVQLIDAQGTVEGTGGQLSLVDQNGAVITNAKQIDINQGGTKVAVGTYDYRANTGPNNDGLYVSYGLKEIDLQGTAANALVLAPSAGATGLATDLSAKVTGTGDLAIAAGAGKTVSLSNGGNTYTGETLAQTGTLKLADNDVLGKTANLVISTGAIVDMNGKSQSVGQINTATGGKLDITAGSTLTVDNTQRNGGTSGGSLEANTLFGSGDFIIDPSIIDVNGANTNYSGNVTVTGGSEIIMNNVQGVGDVGSITLATAADKLTLGELATEAGTNPNGELKKTIVGLGEVALKDTADVTLAANNSSFAGIFTIDTNTHLRASEASNLGTAAITNNGELHLLTDSDWEFINTFTGIGNLEKQGAATLTVNHNLAHTGKTDINAGTLLVGDSVGSAATLSGGGDVNVAAAAILSGTGSIIGKVNNAGTIASLNALSAHSSDGISNLTVGALTNSGTVMLAGSTTGNTLTVKGGLTSNDGRIVMNTELGDDSSVTDKLILDGGTTTGNTSLVIQDKGDGQGALTIQGIRLVETQNGATTAADAFKLDSASSGYRNGVGTLAIGAYDYSLKRGGEGGIADDWYLTSAVSIDPTPSPEPTPSNSTPAARPEAGSYLENQRVAQNMFNMTLHDREGMRPAGQEADRGGVWARVVDTRTKSHSDNDRLDTTGDSDIIQIGAELINWQGANSNFVAGVMGGYGKADSKTSSAAYDYSSKGKVEGYSAGLFGTWYQNQEMTGLYVDSWFQYGWYKNEANGDGLAQDKYNSTAWTASVEAGYALPIGETNGYQWIIEPQAQIGYTDYSADSHRDAGGTRIELQDNSGVTTRVGAKLYSRKITTGGNTVQPFIQMNWLHNQNSGQVMMNNDVVQNNVPKDIGELKIGLESTFNTNWSVWGNLGLQQGSHDYSQVSGQAGVKYSW